MTVKWHYGPTDRDPDPSSMWHDECGGRVSVQDAGDETVMVCGKCGRTEVLDVESLLEEQAQGPDIDDVLDAMDPEDADVSPGYYAYDWPTIRMLYVTGFSEDGIQKWPTLQELAERFNCKSNRIRIMSAREGWTSQRAAHQAELDRAAKAEKVAKFVAAGEKLDAGALRSAEFGVELCTARLVEIAEAHRAAKHDGKESFSRIDARELEMLARAADMFHRLGMRAVGDPGLQRMEVSGVNGQPIELELRRDDPSRLAGVLSVLERAGFGEILPGLVAGSRGIAGATSAIEVGS